MGYTLEFYISMAGVIIFAIICMALMRKIQTKDVQLLKKQAKKRNGTFDKGSNSPLDPKYPSISFYHNDIEIEVSKTTYIHGGMHGFASTITHIIFSLHTHYDCEFIICSKTLVPSENFFKYDKKLGESLNFLKINLENSTFDTAFSIQSNNEKFIHDIFTPTLQDRLLGKKYRQEISFLNGTFTLSVEILSFSEEEYDWLIDTAIMFCDRLQQL